MTEPRYFNTSGPNIPAEHYTLMRPILMEKGKKMVRRSRYFTIWAPRQTGKSTYFHLLAKQLQLEGYEVAHINFENYSEESKEAFLGTFRDELHSFWGIDFSNLGIAEVFHKICQIKERKLVLIIDEIEGINPEYFSSFLHSIRASYHSRERHCLKSVILVGVANITGVIQDNASPFNANDNLNVSYFSKEEIFELLEQHETESGQLFSPEVKEKIAYITAGQPGLVNGFGASLVEKFTEVACFEYAHYLEIEKSYLNRKIDKNIANIINKGKMHRKFMERLLFDEKELGYNIYDERVKFLTVNGLITHDENDNIVFHVPLYKKCLQAAFQPPLNGESEEIRKNINSDEYFTKNNLFDLEKLIREYQAYALRRGFRYFMQKDKDGKPTGLIEAALVHSFDTYIQSFLKVVEGKSYLEPHVALGRSDLIINIQGNEFVIEAKVYRDSHQFKKGKVQLAYYLKSLKLTTGIYLVFVENDVTQPQVLEAKEIIEGVEISTYLVRYDVSKDFGIDLKKWEDELRRL